MSRKQGTPNKGRVRIRERVNVTIDPRLPGAVRKAIGARGFSKFVEDAILEKCARDAIKVPAVCVED